MPGGRVLDSKYKNEDLLKKLPNVILQFELFGFLNASDAKNLARASTLFKNTCRKQLNTMLLQHVAYGEQEQAEELLQMDPTLLLMKGNVTDYSFRHFKNITAFQYALWALDRHMWQMLLKYLPKDQAAEQLNELEEHGTDYGKHYDFSSLINALEVYYRTYGFDFNSARDCWHKVVGGAQRNVPAHVAHEYCYKDRPIYTLPTFTETYLPRNLFIQCDYTHNYCGIRTYWFPLSINTGLGFDFAVDVLASVRPNPPCVWNYHRDKETLTAMKTLSQVRWEELNALKTMLGLSEEITPKRKSM